MGNDNIFNRRSERRVSLDMITLPFLATRDTDQQPFEYMLVDVSPSGAQFAIPKWAASRERLEADTIINLHLSLMSDGSSFAKGKVVWAKRDETAYSELYAISMFQKTPVFSPFAISAENAGIAVDMEKIKSLSKYLIEIIKYCFLLKKGVSIYLKHLIPYFSRIGNYPEADYPLLKNTVLNEIRNHVMANHDSLKRMHLDLSTLCVKEDDIPRYLNLEELRSLVESEINIDIFTATFESEKTAPYISAIKELEKKLYANYNVAVMIYLLAL